MDTVYILTTDGELYHWGTKGMKWGRRLYQNKDGSLTPLGKKRYAKEETSLKEREKYIKSREKARAKQAKLDAKKAELDARERALNGEKTGDNTPSKPKTIKDMTDDELRNLTSRMELEKKFYEAQTNLAKVTPQKTTAFDKIKDKYLDDIVNSVVVEPGKKYVGKIIEKKLGLEEKNTLAILEKQWKEMDYKKKIAEAERDIKKAKNPEAEKPNYENENKRFQYEDNLAKQETNRKLREIERMKTEKTYADQKEIYDAWLEEQRKKRQEQGED